MTRCPSPTRHSFCPMKTSDRRKRRKKGKSEAKSPLKQKQTNNQGSGLTRRWSSADVQKLLTLNSQSYLSARLTRVTSRARSMPAGAANKKKSGLATDTPAILESPASQNHDLLETVALVQPHDGAEPNATDSHCSSLYCPSEPNDWTFCLFHLRAKESQRRYTSSSLPRASRGKA